MSAFMPEALLATAFVCVFAATALLWYAAAKLLAELERLREALRRGAEHGESAEIRAWCSRVLVAEEER